MSSSTHRKIFSLVVHSGDRGTKNRQDFGPYTLQPKCSLWHGHVTAGKDTKLSAIKLMGPQGAPCVTYTTRVLIFFFSGDDKLERVMRLPKQPPKMRLDN